MATFTTRVELHGATRDDYETLHDAMEGEGFSRKIKGDDGTRYHLPEAEYTISGVLTRTDVLDRAERAADQTGRSSSLLVTEAVGRSWRRLSKA
jgi:hypothetical protein